MQDLNDMMWSYHDFTTQETKLQPIEQKDEIVVSKFELTWIKPSTTKVISINKKWVA